jgi:A118 family predicted phage portal protein
MSEFKVEEKIKEIYGRSPIPHSSYLQQWVKWYKGYDGSFHTCKRYNPFTKTYFNYDKMTLNMAKEGSEKWADLMLNEKTFVAIPSGGTEDKPGNDNVNLCYHLENTDFWSVANQGEELDMAFGGGAFVQTLINCTRDIKGKRFVGNDGEIKIEFIDAENIWVLKKAYGQIIDCAFTSIGSEDATILIHELLDENKLEKYGYGKDMLGKYLITSISYVKDDGGSWKEDGEPNQVIVDTKWFSYWKPAKVNNKDDGSVRIQGISWFANAIDQLKNIDDIYDEYHEEVELSKKSIFYSVDLDQVEQDADGNVVRQQFFDVNEKRIIPVPKDIDMNQPFFKEASSPIRAEQYEKALNGALSKFADSTGFGKNYFIYNGEASGGRPVQTATGIIAQNSDLFRSIQKHEVQIEKCLVEVAQMVCDASKYTSRPISKIYDKAEVTVTFDDSIFEDKDSKKTSDLRDVLAGTMSAAEYRAKYTGESLEDANKNLLKNAQYVATQLSLFAQPFASGLVTAKQIVDIVYGDTLEEKQKNELIEYIENNKAKGIDGDILDQIINGQMNNA